MVEMYLDTVYDSNSFKSKGIGIIKIENLFERREALGKPHLLDFYLFIFLTRGESEHFIDFSWRKVRKGMFVYLAEGQISAFKLNAKLEGYVILFTKDYLNKQLDKIPKEAFICLFTPHLYPSIFEIPNNTGTISYIDFLYQEYICRKGESSQEYIIDSLYAIIFAKIEQLKKHNILHPNESNKLALFLKFETILEKEYQFNRNASYYAKKLHVTYQYLNHLCKEVVGQSTKRFIDSFVILEAKRKLINSDIKSSELAHSMGFEESTNFVKYFKKHTKFTPNQFKNLHIQ
ncbi:helix-turn-helix domain-containing protein [Flagellimonas sp. 2504JD4-2]